MVAGVAIRPDEAESLVQLAGQAPSVHNTQPWGFRLHDGVLELRADWSRHLPGTDPDGRQLVVSCGAALFGVRLGVVMLGHVPQVELLPDDWDSELLARVGLGPAAQADSEQVALANAVSRRRTVRTGLAADSLPSGLVAAVRAAAAQERTVLLVLEDQEKRRAVADLVAAAERAQGWSPEVVRELTAWTSRPPSSADGLPAGGWLKQVPQRSLTELPGRDFGRRSVRARPRSGVSAPEAGAPTAPVGGPVAAALVTRSDTLIDWLRAGQALQRVLLTAAAAGVQASLHSQLFGLLGLRSLLRAELTGGAEPQMLLQLGRPVGPATGPTSARRRARDMLVLEGDDR